jgi:hypothetical protein
MRMARFLFIALPWLWAVTPVSAGAQAANPTVVAAGPTDASGSGLRLLGTVAQPVVGASSGGASALVHGFWGVGRTPLVSDVEDPPPPPPTRIAFGGAHPNPFRDDTRLTFALPEAAHVAVQVYDMEGRLVASLTDGVWSAGVHHLPFTGSGLEPGIYFARFEAGLHHFTRKLVRLR